MTENVSSLKLKNPCGCWASPRSGNRCCQPSGSLNAVEFPERKVHNLFDFWQFSTLFRIFNSWKGISPGNVPPESWLLFILSLTVCCQLPTQLHLPRPLLSRSLVALPTQGLFVMKSFKMVSQSGENTCFWSVWWNTFPLRINFSIFYFLRAHITYHYLSFQALNAWKCFTGLTD